MGHVAAGVARIEMTEDVDEWLVQQWAEKDRVEGGQKREMVRVGLRIRGCAILPTTSCNPRVT